MCLTASVLSPTLGFEGGVQRVKDEYNFVILASCEKKHPVNVFPFGMLL
jgi:hypothetical protein